MTTSKSSPVGKRSSLHTKFSTTALSLALATVFSSVSLPADAAGLGRLTVNSGLGQPLRAEVEITSLTDDEASSLRAQLARPEAFRQAGLEFNPALTGLRFDIQRRGAGAVVRISSSRPVNEPFVDLLIELNWNSGKFVREYTFLLDPPELRVGQPQPIEGGASQTSVVTPTQAPNSAVAPAAAQVQSNTAQPNAAALAAQVRAERAAADASAAATNAQGSAAPVPQPTPAPVATNAPTSRVVQRGDTLAVIARELQPDARSLNQAMVAIYRKNESAFFGSVHQLRAGAVLELPTQDEISAVTSADAVREMQASNQAWAEYRARLAEAASASAETSTAGAESNAAIGTIGAASEDTSGGQTASDELRLSRDSSAATSSAATATGEATAAQETDIAREAALRNAQGRVSELERNVADLQRLLELKNKQLADLGNQVAELETANEAAAATTGAVNGLEPAADAIRADSAEAESTPIADAPATAEVTAEAAEASTMTPLPDAQSLTETATDAASGAATDTVEAATDAASETLVQAENAVSETVEQATDASLAAANEAAAAASQAVAPTAPEPAPAPTPAPAAPVAQSESMVDTVMNTVTANPIVPVGAAALIAIGGFFAWRRRKSKKTEERFEDTLGGDDAFAANSLFGTTGGQDVDTSNSLFNTGMATDSAVDVHSTEVDPIAEAEVYIAYGREAQAEEILKEALKRQPDRQAIRLKLLEIYAGRKDSVAYGAVAREMYDATGGQNEEWPKVITMGLSVDPENPLYTGDTDDARGPGAASGAAGAAAAGAAAVGAAGVADALSDSDQASSSPMTDAINTSFESLASEAEETSESISAAEPQAIEGLDDDDMNSLDFDLDINTEIDTKMPVGDDSANLNAALEANVEMPSLDLEADTEGNVMAKSGQSDELSVEIPSLDTMRGQFGSESVDADLASVGLDLSSETDAAPSGDGAKWQEMATKLDLASAYEEIGDKEGARELLDEVLKDGDNAQQQKARAMLSKIS